MAPEGPAQDCQDPSAVLPRQPPPFAVRRLLVVVGLVGAIVAAPFSLTAGGIILAGVVAAYAWRLLKNVEQQQQEILQRLHQLEQVEMPVYLPPVRLTAPPPEKDIEAELPN